MKNRSWVALVITYAILESVDVLGSYILGHTMLQMPIFHIYIITGFQILAITLGMVIGIIYLIGRKKQ